MNITSPTRTTAPASNLQLGAVQEVEQFLTFVLSGEAFALGIRNIKEIIQYGDVTEVPMMPHFIQGVINLRGKVVPVIDLATRFNRGKTVLSRRTSIVIIDLPSNVELAGQSMGIVVDAVNEVVEISAKDIEPPPTYGAQIRPDFISGMAKRNGKFVIVLNLDRILTAEQFNEITQSSNHE